MRIHSLTLTNYRGVEHLSLTGLPQTGVIVISGNNEQGKSTVLEALHNLLHVKHGSTGQAIRATQPRGKDVGSQATLTATIGPYTFTLSKQWVRKPSCTLEITAPKFEQLTGTAAEDRLANIIAEHMDAALLKTLFVEQGDLNPVFDAAGIPTLASALDQESSEDGTGTTQDDTGIVDKVAKEYHRYFTKTGKPNTGYKDAEKAVEVAREQLAEAQRTYNEVQTWVTEIEQLTSRQSDYEARLPQARAELAQAADALAVAETAKTKLDSATATLTAATEALDRITERITDREELAAELDKANADRKIALAAHDQAQEAASREEKEIAVAQEAIDKTFADEKLAAEKLKAARSLVDLGAAHAELTVLRDTHTKVQELDETVEDSDVAPVTSHHVTEVEQATTALIVATKVFEQSATTVGVRAETETTVDLNGDTMTVGPDESTMYLDGVSTFHIGSVELTITPGGSADPQRDVEQAQEKLDALLAELGCESLDEVRVRRDQYAEFLRNKEAYKKDRARILGEHTLETLKADIARYEATLEGVDVADLPNKEVAKHAVEEAQNSVEEIQREREQLRARSAGLMAKPAEQKLTKAAMELGFADERIDSARTKVETAEAKSSMDDLIANRDAAREKVSTAHAELEQAKQQFAESDFDTATMVHTAAKANVDNLTKDLESAKNGLIKFESYVEQSDGSAEDLEHAKLALAHAEFALASLERRATAAQLLYSTLTAHRDAARRKYSQPFADQLARLSRPVFGPDVTYELNEDLKVASRIAGGTEIKVDELSGGAQEQLAIIARFAVAGLIGDATMPVFIDDALGSTDATRLKVMGSVFGEAGRHSQVFVFTCLPERYNYVAGKHEYRMADIKS